MLNGFEFHMYNRMEVYSHLEKVFGLGSTVGASEKKGTSLDELTASTYGYLDWHDLIPVVKLDIFVVRKYSFGWLLDRLHVIRNKEYFKKMFQGRFVFGNHLVPTTLIVNFEEAHAVYTIKPAQSKLDQFTHIVKCKAENAKVLLAPSPKYTGMVDDPPRYMGEGFVVLQSNQLDTYYYMDEPGRSFESRTLNA